MKAHSFINNNIPFLSFAVQNGTSGSTKTIALAQVLKRRP